jgi:hypothetical protein
MITEFAILKHAKTQSAGSEIPPQKKNTLVDHEKIRSRDHEKIRSRDHEKITKKKIRRSREVHMFIYKTVSRLGVLLYDLELHVCRDDERPLLFRPVEMRHRPPEHSPGRQRYQYAIVRRLGQM